MIYTIPALNAVDFGLTEYTAPSLDKHESGLTSYSVPVLSSVDFALTVYTLPSSAILRGRVNFELLAITVSASGFSNTSSFGADSVKFTYTPSAFANSNSFGTAGLTQVTSTIDLTADGVLNVNYFGGSSVSVETPAEHAMTGGVGFKKIGISDRRRVHREFKIKSVVNVAGFGKPKISISLGAESFGKNYFGAHYVMTINSANGLVNKSKFGKTKTEDSYEVMDEERIITMLAA